MPWKRHADQLAAAIADHQAGRLEVAEARYRRLLSQQPEHPDALHLLGVLVGQQGQLKSAVDWMTRALTPTGRHPLVLYNLANVLAQQGELRRPWPAIAKPSAAIRRLR